MSSDSPAVASIVHRLAQVEALLSGSDLASIDPLGLPHITASMRRIEARCSALRMAIAVEAEKSDDDPSATL